MLSSSGVCSSMVQSISAVCSPSSPVACTLGESAMARMTPSVLARKASTLSSTRSWLILCAVVPTLDTSFSAAQ